MRGSDTATRGDGVRAQEKTMFIIHIGPRDRMLHETMWERHPCRQEAEDRVRGRPRPSLCQVLHRKGKARLDV